MYRVFYRKNYHPHHIFNNEDNIYYEVKFTWDGDYQHNGKVDCDEFQLALSVVVKDGNNVSVH